MDADAIVGPKFLLGAEFCLAANLTRLCYRVRNLPIAKEADFSNYESWPLAFEAYGRIDKGEGAFCLLVYGNSQFTASRSTMDDVGPWDEDYFGRGFEDLDMIRRIERKNPQYHAEIMTAADYAMFHIQHAHSPGYGIGRWNDRAERKFYRIQTVWLVCENKKTEEAAEHAWYACPEIEKFKRRLRITSHADFEFQKQEILPQDVYWNITEKSLPTFIDDVGALLEGIHA